MHRTEQMNARWLLVFGLALGYATVFAHEPVARGSLLPSR